MGHAKACFINPKAKWSIRYQKELVKHRPRPLDNLFFKPIAYRVTILWSWITHGPSDMGAVITSRIHIVDPKLSKKNQVLASSRHSCSSRNLNSSVILHPGARRTWPVFLSSRQHDNFPARCFEVPIPYRTVVLIRNRCNYIEPLLFGISHVS